MITTPKGRRIDDLTGQKFSFVTVVSYEGCDWKGNSRWRIKCVCGKELVVLRHNLTQSKVKSCGCKRKKKETAFNSVFSGYKIHARSRGLSFDLSKEEVLILTQKPCYYCGTEKSNLMKRPSGAQFSYNGIDRLDNTQGYRTANVVSCCKICNRMKNDLSVEEFLRHIVSVASYVVSFPVGRCCK